MIEKGTKITYSQKITKNMVNSFIKLTGDLNDIHCSREKAKEAGFEDIVVQGMLCASLGGTAMWKLSGHGTILGEWQKLRFIRPVKIGDTITVEAEVIEAFPPNKSGRNRYGVSVKFQNQKSEDIIEPTEGTMFGPKTI